MKKLIVTLILTTIIFLGVGLAWDNNDFIDQSFWDGNPTSGEIVDALYGDGTTGSDVTAYTTNRVANSCDTTAMSVVYIAGDNDNEILPTLAINTIYVLKEGTHRTNYTIEMNDCSAIVGSGEVTLYNTSNLLIMIRYNDKDNAIIHNIHMNGGSDGEGLEFTTYSPYGIYANASLNNTISKTSVYNISARGISIRNLSHNFTLSDVSVFNISTSSNAYSIFVYGSDNIVLNNVQLYNGNNYGISIVSSDNFALNNVISYNNKYAGITIASSNNGLLNNVIAYNNQYSNGIRFNNANNNILHNVQSYNNGSYGIELITSTNNKYYNTVKLFDNFDGIINGTGLIIGSSSDSIALKMSWNTGVLDITGSIDAHQITNPKSTDDVFLIDTNEAIGTWRGYKSTWNTTGAISYAYGDNIKIQNQPLYYNTYYDSIHDIIYTKGNMLKNSSLYRDINFPVCSVLFNLDTYLQGHKFNKIGPSSYKGSGDIGLRRTDGEIQKDITITDTTSNKFKVLFSANTFVKKLNGENYTGIMTAPEEESLALASILDDVQAVFSFGSDTESLDFENAGGSSIGVPIQYCTGDKVIGQSAGVYYSTDGGDSWDSLGNTTYTDVNGSGCLTIETTHATHFAIALPGGEFSYDMYLSGHKNDDRQDVIVTQGESYKLIIEYSNQSNESVDSSIINKYFGPVKNGMIQTGEAASVILNVIPQKTYAPFWRVE